MCSIPLLFGCNNSVIPDDDTVTRIAGHAFYGCSELTDLFIPASVTSIGTWAFSDTDIKNLYIEDLESWLNVVFGDSTGPTFSNPLQEHGNIYVNGELLTELTIPEGVNEINDGALRNCLSLTKVVIPDHVTKIAGFAFYCTSLTDIYYDGTKEQWLAIIHLHWDYGTGEYTIHFNDGTTMQKGEE